MTTVLVANRGEIAVRVFRTARRMGLRTVAVYSEADAGAPFTRMADLALPIGPAPAAASYLRADNILAAAAKAGADLVHPGFGFLSEDARFARAVLDAGLAFVGPPPDVLAAMGGKDEAKRIAEAAGVPTLPGYGGVDQTDAALTAAADEVGFPLIVKPAAGGGGKGMSVVTDPAGLTQALETARRVAAAAFGDDRLILERYLPGPRHVEVQILADGHGHVIHLGERDCSLQRRHQKILEETPSPAIDAATRAHLCESAVALARHVGYRNAGTCEFLVEVSPGAEPTYGFIEMNARLQVEHPVTEAVTGIDLVEWQLRVAMGEELTIAQSDVRPQGHAIEVRLYAEDPDQGFLPQAGRLAHVRWPQEARIDSGVEEGAAVTTHYDPMLAKVIVHDTDRDAAFARLDEALAATEILGVRTNIAFLRAVAADPVVRSGQVTTTWLEPAYQQWSSGAPEEPPAEVVALAGAAEAARILDVPPDPDPWAPSAAGPWRLLGAAPLRIVVRPGGGHGAEEVVEVAGTDPFTVAGHAISRDGDHAWSVDGTAAAVAPGADGHWYVLWGGLPYEIAVGPRPRLVDAEGGPAHLGAPMPGTVIAVRVEVGEKVTKGQELVVVEAMKMELAVKANADAIVAAVKCAPGDQVGQNQTLVDLEPIEVPS